MKIRTACLLLMVTFLISSCSKIQLNLGKKNYHDFEYDRAIHYLEKGLSKRDDFEAKFMLANVYIDAGHYSSASQIIDWIILDPSVSDYDRLEFARAYMSAERYDDAIELLQGILSRQPGNEIAQSFMRSCRGILSGRMQPQSRSAYYAVLPFSASDGTKRIWEQHQPNPEMDEFYAVVSTIERGGLSFAVEAQTNVYVGTREELNVNALSSLVDLNSRKFSARSLAFANNGNTIFYTQGATLWKNGNFPKEATYNASSRTTIMTATRNGSDSWSEPESLPFCPEECVCADPWTNEDGSRLIFSTVRPDGFGGMDLYEVLKLDGEWSQPRNLGGVINSPGNESHAQLHDGVLYFSSDSQEGFGGLDIFKSEFRNGEWVVPTNLGTPINSSADDFGLKLTSTNGGTFLSTRVNVEAALYTYQEINAPSPGSNEWVANNGFPILSTSFPTPSRKCRIIDEVIQPGSTLSQASDKISGILKKAGFKDLYFFGLEDPSKKLEGFVISTHHWAPETPSKPDDKVSSNVGSYTMSFWGILTAAGDLLVSRFQDVVRPMERSQRIYAFVVTAQGCYFQDDFTPAEIRNYFGRGSDRRVQEFESAIYSGNHHLEVFLYEVIESKEDGRDHLLKEYGNIDAYLLNQKVQEIRCED